MIASDYMLIAEPDERLSRTFESIAVEAQLVAATARDGHEAIGILKERGAPALLVTNLVLAKHDGFAVLAELRKVSSATDAPAVVVSSSMQLRTLAMKQKEQLGIAEVAATAMSAATLRATLRRALLAGSRPLATSERPRARSLAPRPALPSRDPERLRRITEMRLVDDRPPDAELQRLVQETARAFNVPIALVSLVLEDRQWFKAHVGLSGALLKTRGTPIDEAFCRHVVDADTASPLIVPDAKHHPLFADNPWVRGGAIGSYAGAPLLTSDGKVLGTLCIIDEKPLKIGNDEVDLLITLARRVAGELDLRASESSAWLDHRAPAPVRKHEQALTFIAPVVAQLEQGAMLSDEQHNILLVNRALTELLGSSADELVGQTHQALIDRIRTRADAPKDIDRRLRVPPAAPFVAREDLEFVGPTRCVLRWSSRPARLPTGLVQVSTFSDVTLEVEQRELSDLDFFLVEDLDRGA